MLKASIRSDNPVLFTESIGLYRMPGPMPDEDDYVSEIGKAAVTREGTDVTLITLMRGVRWCEKAARQLEKDGISAEIIDVRWLRPLDTETIFNSFKKTHRAVVVEEMLPMYSFGSEIAAQIQDNCFDWMDAPVKRLSQVDVPLPYSKELELMAYPQVEDIVQAVKEIV